MSFVQFGPKSRDDLIYVISRLKDNMPNELNQLDYRMAMSQYYCERLEAYFSALSTAYSKGYDMRFEKKVKVSLKFQTEIFQRAKIHGHGLTRPHEIIMKNCLGGQTPQKMKLDIDYLLAIQTGKNHQTGSIFIGFGIIGKEKLKPLLYFTKGDQIKVQIDNSDYDYFSQLHEISASTRNHKSECDRMFSEGLSKLFQNIYNIPSMVKPRIVSADTMIWPVKTKTQKMVSSKRRRRAVSTVSRRKKKY